MRGVFPGSLAAILCAGLFALALGPLGGVLIFRYIRNTQKRQLSAFWPSTTEKITRHKIRIDETQDESPTSVCHVPEIHYGYEVDGTFFQGTRLSFGSEPGFPSR